MKRKLLAFVCLLAVLVGVFAIGATATTQQDTYQVGYAKVDVSPWIKDYPSATNMTDDNGNAIGITYDPAWEEEYADYMKTVSVVVDTKSGKATNVGFINAEIGYSGRVYNTVVDTNGDNLRGKGDGIYSTATSVTDSEGNTVIFVTIDAIGGYPNLLNELKKSVVAGVKAAGGNIQPDQIYLNASHSHRGIDLSRLAQNKAAPVQAYWTYYKQMVSDAAVSAYVNRTPSTMSKGQVDVSEVVGHQMNFIRHYNTNKVDDTTGKSIIRGSNFGGSKGTQISHVYDADDMLYLLQFTPTNGDTPIVLMNWRAHGTMVGKSDALSGDHIGAIRSTMERAGYRFAFLQGAAGNTVPRSAIEILNTWKTETTSGYKYTSVDTNTTVANDENQVNHYGYLMTMAAKECLNNHMEQLSTGKIRNTYYNFVTNKHKETAAEIEAALYWNNVMGAPTTKGQTYVVDGVEYTFPGYPWIYTSSTGEKAIFDSQYHVLNAFWRNETEAGQAATQNGAIKIHAIMLGDEVAMVTCGNEISDRYSLTDELVYTEGSGWKLRDNDNDWKDLYSAVYGTPFVLGYTSGEHAYMSNSLSYTYNQGSEALAGGCYESETSRFAQGTGEAMIVKFQEMLDTIETAREAHCPDCNETVKWTALDEVNIAKLQDGTDGHYYLVEDVSVTDRIILPESLEICLDLNGYALTSTTRVFETTNTTTLNLIDSVGTGTVTATAVSTGFVGGIAQIKGACNIYGGTYRLTEVASKNPTAGGLFAVQYGASMNIYGGTFYGASLSDTLHGYTAKDGCGSAIYMYGASKLLIGGDARIISGAVPSHGFGTCIYVHDKTCKVTLQGSADVDQIYFPEINGTNLIVSGAYTGAANIQLGADIALADSVDIGTSDNADLSGATVTCVNDDNYALLASGTDLILQRKAVAYIGQTPYCTLQAAVNAAEAADTIRLVADIAETVSVTKNATLDLNGYGISKVVADGGTLFCFDSQTDDYDVADGVYGKLTGNAVAAEGYLAVTEADGTSFHKVDLAITAMSLRASDVGVYYKSSFLGDEVVAKSIAKYGVALNIHEAPSAANMATTSAYSYFTNFASGSNNGTLLKNIMKTSNADKNNERNANISVYGAPYILTTTGEYIFGETVQRSLRQQLEAIDAAWNSYSEAAQKTVIAMYRKYANVMKNWNISNIESSADYANDGVTRILGIGNSYTIDSMHLLGEIYKAEKPGTNLELGIAYYSGCSLQSHVNFYNANDAVYGYYYYNSETDSWTVTNNMTLKQIIQAQDWDMVSLQQNSSGSGVASGYNYIPTVRGIVEKELNYKPTYLWNMTWAVPEVDIPTDKYTLDDAPNANSFKTFYGSSQATMYKKIVECVQNKVVPDTALTYLVPVGTAIQNANATFTDYDLYRDYTHLNDYARLIAAYTWYCELEGITLGQTIGVTTIPTALTNSYKGGDYALNGQQITVLINAVNSAMTNKFVTTDTSVYQ